MNVEAVCCDNGGVNTSKMQSTARSRVLAGVMTAMLGVGAAACGGGGESTVPLSEAGERGRKTSNSNGCASCHGENGQGGVGPPWIGLAGSDVELAGGGTIVADDAYLVRAIAEPGADLLADYTLQMPRNNLSDAEIADVVAYIKDLAAPAPRVAGENPYQG